MYDVSIEALEEQYRDAFPNGIASIDPVVVYSSIPIVCDGTGNFSIPQPRLYSITLGDDVTPGWGSTQLVHTNLNQKSKLDNEQAVLAMAHGYDLFLWGQPPDGAPAPNDAYSQAQVRMWLSLAGAVTVGRQKRYYEHPIAQFALGSIAPLGDIDAGGRAVAPSDRGPHHLDVPLLLSKGGGFNVEIDGGDLLDGNILNPGDPTPTITNAVWCLRHAFYGIAITEVK